MSAPLFAAVRVQRIGNMTHLRAAESHGQRTDPAAARRVDPARTPQNLAESRYSPDNPLALVDAFKAFKRDTGAVEGQGKAALALHIIAVVSPDLIAPKDDPARHDPATPMNRVVFDQAQAWARAQFGDASLIAARMDMDEAGAGVVDLFVTPTAMQSGGRRKAEKLTISVNSGLKAAQEDWGTRTSYEALQTSWAGWAAENIDARLQRGQPKRETEREHVHADVFRPQAEALARQAQILAAREMAVKGKEAAAEYVIQASHDAEVKAIQRVEKLEEQAAALGGRIEVVERREKALAQREQDIEASEARGIERGLKRIGEVVKAWVAGEIEGVIKTYQGGWVPHFRPDLPEPRRQSLWAAIGEIGGDIIGGLIDKLAKTVSSLREAVSQQEARQQAARDTGWELDL